MLSLNSIRAHLPGKRYVRSMINSLQRIYDERLLTRYIEALRAGAPADRALLGKARAAWGNEGYSADLRYLEEMTARVARCSGPILECGTGLTTLLAGVLAEKRAVPVLSIEQDEA